MAGATYSYGPGSATLATQPGEGFSGAPGLESDDFADFVKQMVRRRLSARRKPPSLGAAPQLPTPVPTGEQPGGGLSAPRESYQERLARTRSLDPNRRVPVFVKNENFGRVLSMPGTAIGTAGVGDPEGIWTYAYPNQQPTVYSDPALEFAKAFKNAASDEGIAQGAKYQEEERRRRAQGL
jgi:hypothetical protein